MQRALWLLVLLWPTLALSDPFDNAVRAIRIETSAQDFSGATVRGGANFSTGASQTTTLLRGSASIGGGCSAFNFGASMKELMENIPEVIQGFSQRIISALPMVLTCYVSPTVCSVGQHIQTAMNMLIQARYASCQSSQNAAMYTGLRLRGGQVSRCLEVRQIAGDTISQALQQCNSEPFDLLGPDGLPKREVRLFEDTLAAAGASPETQGIVTSLLGEVTMRAGNQFGVDARHPIAALHGRYEYYRSQYQESLTKAVDELQQTGTVTAATLREVAVPGQPMPRAAVNALAGLRSNPARYEAAVGRLSTQMALTHLTWECGDLEEKLAAAADGNPRLSDEERKAMEHAFQALRRKLAITVAQVDAGEKYGAALDKVLEEYARVEATASRLALEAPSVQIAPSRYGTQLPMGFSK